MAWGCSVGVLAGLLAVAFELAFPGEICEYNQATKHEECTDYSVLLFFFIKVVKTLNDYGVAITGLATVFLTFITWQLVIVARDQSKTTRAQLRAYIWVAESSINDVVGADYVHPVLKIQNSGQTPATDVIQWANQIFGPYPLGHLIKELPGRLEPEGASKSYLGPGGCLFLEPKAQRLYSPQEKAAINAKTGAIYVWGEINYVDAFREDRSTKFILFKGGDMGTQGPQLYSYRDGNEAT